MFGRLSCHFCGRRSKYSRGTIQFQCTNCEAFNFYDQKGNVLDAPDAVVNTGQHHIQSTSPNPPKPAFRPEESQVFCNKCLNNQRIHMESVSNYLPDEGDPRYKEFEDALPRYKAHLEEKYPQLCKRCAPIAQRRVHEADRYGMTRQVATAMNKTRARRGVSPVGQRDDWSKRTMRLAVSLIGMIVYASILIQAMWHAYGMLSVPLTHTFADDIDLSIEYELEPTPYVFDPTLKECAQQLLHLRFDRACQRPINEIMPKALLTSLCLIWYNHGLKAWWDRTYRIEAIHGKSEHFSIQLLLLTARFVAWSLLSDSSFTAGLDAYQFLAAHGFMIVFMIFAQALSERPIRSEIWRIHGEIMPSPSQKDVFGATAGPAEQAYTRQASSIPPLRLFSRDERPFPIENLAPRPQGERPPPRSDHRAGMPPPSPPDSAEDAMDIDDWQPTRTAWRKGAPISNNFQPKAFGGGQPKPASVYDTRGWAPMRDELFGIEDKNRHEKERKRKEEEDTAKVRAMLRPPPPEQSPFRGRLPPAPMSMERRLRNPWPQPAPTEPPLLTQNKNFWQDMRNGISSLKPNENKASLRHVPGLNVDDEDFSPAKSTAKNIFNVQDSGWKLPADFARTTGLEDMFAGNTFAISDEQRLGRTQQAPIVQSSNILRWICMALTALLIITAIAYRPVRRVWAIWLLNKLEDMGY